MNEITKANIFETIFKIARKYNMNLTYRNNSKRNIDIYSLTKNNPTIKRLKVEVGERINFTVYKFDVISNTKKYSHSVCKFDDVKNIYINDLCEYNNNWEHFVDDLMYHLDFYKLNK